jgi:hypothetical protein
MVLLIFISLHAPFHQEVKTKAISNLDKVTALERPCMFCIIAAL